MKDCYFFIECEPGIPEEERRVRVLCEDCHEKHMPDAGWFYPGSKEGYGPYTYQCHMCKTIIYKGDNDEAETSD
jgi:hypothetical protein